MRQLSREEKILNNKAIRRFKKENEHAEYLLKVEQLKLKTGLRLAYEANLTESQKKIQSYTLSLESNNKQIEILTKQNKEGVEPKKNLAG